MALVISTMSLLSGFMFLFLAFIASPFFNILLDRKTGVRIPFLVRVLIILVGFCITSVTLSISLENKSNHKKTTSYIQKVELQIKLY